MTKMGLGSLAPFQHLYAVVVAVVDENGNLLSCNNGFRRLYRPQDNATPNVADFFVLPSFNRLVSTLSPPGQPLHHGVLNVGDIQRGCRSLIGTVHRDGTHLIMVAEYDVAEMEAITTQMLQINEELIETQRELTRKERLLRASESHLRELTLTDPLTGLSNRRHLDEFLLNECERKHRSGEVFSVIAADLDYFKRINDRYGHEGGDTVLQHFAHLLRANMRTIDLVARTGGEEFILVMPMTGIDEAIQTAERLRADSLKMRVPTVHDVVSASFGVVQSQPEMSLQTLLKCADTALYAAKQRGRNRVEAYRPDAPGPLPPPTEKTH